MEEEMLPVMSHNLLIDWPMCSSKIAYWADAVTVLAILFSCCTDWWDKIHWLCASKRSYSWQKNGTLFQTQCLKIGAKFKKSII